MDLNQPWGERLVGCEEGEPPPPSSTPLDLAADGGDLRGSPTLTKMLNKRLPWGAPRDVKQLIWMEDKIATFIHFTCAPVKF